MNSDSNPDIAHAQKGLRAQKVRRFNCDFSRELFLQLEALAKRTNIPRREVLQDALLHYLHGRRRRPERPEGELVGRDMARLLALVAYAENRMRTLLTEWASPAETSFHEFMRRAQIAGEVGVLRAEIRAVRRQLVLHLDQLPRTRGVKGADQHA